MRRLITLLAGLFAPGLRPPAKPAIHLLAGLRPPAIRHPERLVLSGSLKNR